MNEYVPDVDSIFCRAVDILSADERAAYIQSACGSDLELRRRVERLLKAHFQAGSFMHSPVVDSGETVNLRAIAERPGTVIGRYRLLQQIGEGGFGVVFMAEQLEPVRRKVALKIIKPGMDTKEVIARFEAEGQALALMDHPNIAKIFDAGSTDSGRPFFVMELVKGVPITDYCDQAALTTRERLDLFKSVCQAVQHAHQKNIIHRDIKPKNVLVTLHDGTPVVKVIDFGIAKAIDQRLTERTLFTEYGQMIGTTMYMSPEQAEISGLEVDTRTDVYSLGVLLYELLTGSTPFDTKRLHDAAYDEVRRIIREEEPPVPSKRISTLGKSLSEISARRRTEPNKLSTSVRGDLDWIVMKALDKDRRRRYISATAFAADIERHLEDKPIEACPPSTTYRLGKFLRRNRRGVTGAVVITAALTLAIVAFLKPPRAADPRGGLLDRAHVFVQQQRYPEAVEAFQQVLNWDRTHRGDESPEYRSTSLELARLYDSQGRYAQSVELYDRVLEQQKRKLGPEHKETLRTRWDFSGALNRMSWAVALEGSNADFAETLAKKAVSVSAEVPATPQVFAWMTRSSAYHSLAFSQIQSRRPREALECLENRVDWYNPHPWYLMAIALHQTGQKEKARNWYAVASDSTDQDDYVAMHDLRAMAASTLGLQETWPPADWNAEKGIEACTQLVTEYPKVSWLFNRRGAYRAHLGKWTEAASDYAKAAELLPWEPAHALKLGVICLYLGDRQKYAEACRRSFAAESVPILGDIVDEDYHSARLMLLASLSPDTTPEAEDLCKHFHRYLPGSNSHPWMKICKALAYYRSGLYRESLASMPYDKDWQGRTFGQLFRAMAQCRLGNTLEAQQTLNEARFEILQRVPNYDTGALIRDEVMYLNSATAWCALQVLLREAESLIEPSDSASHPSKK